MPNWPKDVALNWAEMTTTSRCWTLVQICTCFDHSSSSSWRRMERWKDCFESKATLHLPKLITRAWRLDRANQIQVSNSRKVQVRALGRGRLTREISGYPKQCIAPAMPTCSWVDWKFCKIPMKTTKAPRICSTRSRPLKNLIKCYTDRSLCDL